MQNGHLALWVQCPPGHSTRAECLLILALGEFMREWSHHHHLSHSCTIATIFPLIAPILYFTQKYSCYISSTWSVLLCLHFTQVSCTIHNMIPASWLLIVTSYLIAIDYVRACVCVVCRSIVILSGIGWFHVLFLFCCVLWQPCLSRSMDQVSQRQCDMSILVDQVSQRQCDMSWEFWSPGPNFSLKNWLFLVLFWGEITRVGRLTAIVFEAFKILQRSCEAQEKIKF